MFFFAGCGFFGSGGEEVTQSQPGRTIYRATDEGGTSIEKPASQKVPGETR
jgi:hypothetical protein